MTEKQKSHEDIANEILTATKKRLKLEDNPFIFQIPITAPFNQAPLKPEEVQKVAEAVNVCLQKMIDGNHVVDLVWLNRGYVFSYDKRGVLAAIDGIYKGLSRLYMAGWRIGVIPDRKDSLCVFAAENDLVRFLIPVVNAAQATDPEGVGADHYKELNQSKQKSGKRRNKHGV